MTDDQLKSLLQKSQSMPSEDFTLETMDKLDLHLIKKMRRRLFWLILGTFAFFLGIAGTLIASGFQVNAFDIRMELPKSMSMVMISLIGVLMIRDIFYLRQLSFLQATD